MNTFFYNGIIHSLNDKDATYTGMGVRGGRIAELCGGEPRNRYAKRVDLQGAHVYPAMTDAHLHLTSTLVLAASSFFVCTVTEQGIEPRTMAGVERRIRDYCAGKGEKDLIVANGYITAAIDEKTLPTRQMLDEWTGGRRCVVYTMDGHSSALSTAMMRAAGMEPEGHSGILTGVEHEFQQGKVTDVIASSVTLPMLARGITNFTNTCYSYGITRVCALEGNGDLPVDRFTKMIAQLASRMEIAVRLYPQFREIEKARAYWPMMRTPRIGGCGEWEMDGAVGSHSAAFSRPYADNGAVMPCYYSDDAVLGMISEAEMNGCQSATHAIGDSAIDLILDAHSKVRGRCLHRIEHFEFPSPEAVETLCGSPNLAITVQPGFAWLDKKYMHGYEAYLPPASRALEVPIKTLLDRGACVCGSSDSPVQSINPFVQMMGMVDAYIEGQSVSAKDALRTYTVNPAKVLGELDESGTLEIGKRADFFVTASDFDAVTKETLPDTRVLATYVGGRLPKPKKGTVAELACMMLRRPHKI